MKKKILLYILLLFNIVAINSQTNYGFEWIDFSKPHYKIPIVSTNVYRISQSYLAVNCPEILNAPSAEICIYNNGKQIPIYLSWNNTSVSSDYIEFFATKLDGSIDSKLYKDSSYILNPFTSFIKDTNYVYLTLRTGKNERILTLANDTSNVTGNTPYCIASSIVSYRSNYNGGQRFYYSDVDYVESAAYDRGEGYGTNAYSNTINLNTSNFYPTTAYPPQIWTRIFGRNNTKHNLSFKINNNEINNTIFYNSDLFELKTSFSNSLINSNTTSFNINASNPGTHGYCLGFVSLKYARNFNFSGLNLVEFEILKSTNIQKIEISNYSNSNTEAILYDLTNKSRIVQNGASSLRFIVNSSTENPNLKLFNTSLVNNISYSTKINYSNLLLQKGQLILISTQSISKDSLGKNILYDYKLYKETTEGGSFSTVLAYTDELSELFAFGIPKHPLAIKKYLQWAYKTWIPSVQYALLLGKGYPVTNLLNASNTAYNQNLIPSYGIPASDFGYVTLDTSNTQFIPIGRLSCSTPYDINNYLNKLKEYDLEYNAISSFDQIPSKKEYMKWVIHLAGGTGIDQQSSYRSFLQEYEQKIKDTCYGAKVFAIYKNTVDITQDFTSIDLESRINKGVSLISFFGHSSASLFDVGIGDPKTFTNKGKYPFFLANGCNSGAVFGTGSYSESFVNLPNKGAIGFLATTNYALDISLYNYGKTFYEQLSKTSNGTTIGHLYSSTSNKMILDLANNNLNYLYTTAMEYNLNGDPSVRFNLYKLADYYIDKNSIYFPKSLLNVTTDSFELKLIVQNLGKAIKAPLNIKLERLNNGNKETYSFTVEAPMFKDTFMFKLPTLDHTVGAGLNTFNIKVDGEETIPELSETNNEFLNTGDLYIESDDILPIYPFEYSIVGGNPKINLIASTIKFDNPIRKYYIEIDTNENFNSTLKKSYETTTSNSTIYYQIPYNLTDSTVYYWRVSKDSTSPSNGYRWNTSSFIYLASQTKGGWNQSHYFQFLKNKKINISLDNDRKFKFYNDFKNIFVRTDGSSNTYEVEWYLNTVRQAVLREAGRMNSGFFVIWLDGKTGIAKQSLDSNFGVATWGSFGSIPFGYFGIPREGFVFPDTGNTPLTHPTPNTSWNSIFLNFINQIPDNDYVIIYSNKKPVYSKWTSSLTNYFKNNGFLNINQLTDTIVKAPFIFAYRKNNLTFTPIATIGTDYTTKTTLTIPIYGSWKEGYVESPWIGPALRWNTLQFSSNSIESINSDNNILELYGQNITGATTILKTFKSNTDTLLDWLSASIYPKIKLKLTSKDETNRTPTQLKYWRILFDDVPEIGINNTLDIIPENIDTIEIGNSIHQYFGIQTLNEFGFDSITVKLTLSQGATKKEFYFKKKPVAGNSKDFLDFEISLDQYFIGQNDILLELNPQGSTYQKEKYSINNFSKSSFFVKPDIYNPLLDVTFDGVHIINNELVSSKPNISITLKDENKFLLLNDTSLLSLHISRPDGSLSPVYFNSDTVKFIPASSAAKNVAQILYNPTLTDGLYSLIVKDKDVSGNQSSKKYNYRIGFRVVSKTQVSHVLNYPNPFSTSTYFVFTITGSKIPDIIKIQILNIKGQIVKEINKEQLGPLKIGLNKTSYAWDGRDEYGDLLANGVYLYKVTIKDKGKEVEQMNSEDFKSITNSTQSIEKFFNNNFGKMVILR